MITRCNGRWSVAAAALLLVAVLFLCAAAQRQSPWHLALDFTNWRIFISEGVLFNPDGTKMKTTKAYHYGPITIASERRWDAKGEVSDWRQ